MFKHIINFIINLVIIGALWYLGTRMGLDNNSVVMVIVIQFLFMGKMFLEGTNE